MTTLLNEVLQHHVPETWDGGNYINQRYRAIEATAEQNSVEYNNVLKEFPASLKRTVTSVYRVQNPYMYGRYRLRIEQLQCRGEDVYEEQWYHPIAKTDKVDVMEYNCDYRRYMFANGSQYREKRPIFYKEPQRAVELFRSFNSDAMSIVVMAVVSTNYLYQTECTRNWDTEYYPEYIVDLNE